MSARPILARCADCALDMPPARLPSGKELERIYWREDTCRKCGHAVRVA